MPALLSPRLRHGSRRLQRAVERDAADSALPVLRPGGRHHPAMRHAGEPCGRSAARVPAPRGQVREEVEADVRRLAQEHMLRRALLPLLRERVQRQDLCAAAAACGGQPADAAAVPHGRRRVELGHGAGHVGDVRPDVRGRGLRGLRPGAGGGLPHGVSRPLLLELDRAPGRHRVELPARLRPGPPVGAAASLAPVEWARRGSIGGIVQSVAVGRGAGALRREDLLEGVLRPVRRCLRLLRERAVAGQGHMAEPHLLPRRRQVGHRRPPGHPPW
mmetsp:Transcript_37203/g.107157  ORF Transcript_37203/g.107157 Transcript_37203/m.107157 type:complete len:274 (+) Transcript_37203:654-1475(+)